MDSFLLAGAFGQIVGLLCDYMNMQKQKTTDQQLGFLEWLEIQNHQEIADNLREIMTQNKKLKEFAVESHETLLKELLEMKKLIINERELPKPNIKILEPKVKCNWSMISGGEFGIGKSGKIDKMECFITFRIKNSGNSPLETYTVRVKPSKPVFINFVGKDNIGNFLSSENEGAITYKATEKDFDRIEPDEDINLFKGKIEVTGRNFEEIEKITFQILVSSNGETFEKEFCAKDKLLCKDVNLTRMNFTNN